MTRAQFTRLTGVHWKTADTAALETSFAEFQRALSRYAPDAIEHAITRWNAGHKGMPAPVDLIAYAKEAMPRSTTRPVKHDSGCPFCGGQPQIAVRDDGTRHRYYLRHDPDCVQPIFAKPHFLAWDGTATTATPQPGHADSLSGKQDSNLPHGGTYLS